jgi:hypothetical protein
MKQGNKKALELLSKLTDIVSNTAHVIEVNGEQIDGGDPVTVQDAKDMAEGIADELITALEGFKQENC